nr:hypothetical protein [Tanacetum cinerariifolium]
MERNIMVTMCKLEKILPPGFFNHMEHLLVHLSYEARVDGPEQYRWMYPFERYLYHLKKKVKNKARVESSEAYIMEEISNFYTHYFESHVETISRRVGRNDDGGNLNPNRKFEAELKVKMPNVTFVQLIRAIEERFGRWIRDYVLNPLNSNLFWSETSNTDLGIVGEDGDYYGQLNDVIELEYMNCSKVVLFKLCRMKARSTIVALTQQIDSAYQEDGAALPFLVTKNDEVEKLHDDEGDMELVEVQHLQDHESEEVEDLIEEEELDEEEELEYEYGSDEDNEAKEKDESVIFCSSSQMETEDVDQKLGKEDMRIVLTIQGGSFNPSNNVTSTISSIWKSRFTGARDNWTIVPTEDKEIWFNSFKEKYTWDAKINTKARSLFNTLGSRGLRDYMSWMRIKGQAHKPPFMHQTVWDALWTIWESPEFIAKSDRGRAARQSNKRLISACTLPDQSRSLSTKEDWYQKELGWDPTAAELFFRTHVKKDMKTFVDSEAKETWEKYMEKYEAKDTLDKKSGNIANTYIRWADHVGSKKGKFYGLPSGFDSGAGTNENNTRSTHREA